MKILDVKFDGYYDFDNTPRLKLLVDHIPTDLVYDQKGNSYFAEKDGFVDFYYYQSPGEGFGGRKFDLNMKDGSVKSLYGPWSSNSKAMFDAGFPDSIDVSITDEQKCWERGYTFFAGNITLDLFKQACKKINAVFGRDRNGFYVPMINCECGRGYTQKYRTSTGRKIMCEDCAKNQGLDEKNISSYINYGMVEIKNVFNNPESSNEQLSIF